MIIYGFIRKFLPARPATFAAALLYALFLVLMFISLSQIGADLRYAN